MLAFGARSRARATPPSTETSISWYWVHSSKRYHDQPLDEFCESRIFTRLGLADTRFFPIPVDGSQAATGTEFGAAWPRPRTVIGANAFCGARSTTRTRSAMGGVAGHAGFFSTADDVLKFGQFFLDAWHGRKRRALPAERVREFSQRQKLPESSDWALGWDTPTEGDFILGQTLLDTVLLAIWALPERRSGSTSNAN